MPRIEQAIFTSVESDLASGYEVVGAVRAFAGEDARELAAWGPSHDSMLDSSPEAESFNFHPLPSGAWCLSRSLPVDEESRPGGQRIYTQCLVVPPDVLARFGNNPFALLHAASSEGLWRVEQPHATALEPLVLSTGGAAAVDQALLAFLAADPGAENIAALVQMARDAVCLALSCRHAVTPLIAGLFSCLPPECRLEFPFSTGLKFSPRRPFRIVALWGDPAERCWIANYPNVAVLELRSGKTPPPMPIDGWTRLVRQTLSTGHIPFLARQLSKRRFHLTPDDLPALGLQLLENMEASNDDEHNGGAKTAGEDSPMASQRSDSPHQRFDKTIASVPAITAISTAMPSAYIARQSPAILEKLEHLDDLVYDAIGGQPDAMDQLRTAWPKLAGELDETLLAESREQYLRYALSIWEDYAQADGVRQPSRAIRALDVLCLLFADAT